MSRTATIVAAVGISPLRVVSICCVYSFFALPCSSLAAPFSVVVLPDTQYYSQSFPEQFRAQTQWIVDNRVAKNIALVSHVGDIVENGGGRPSQDPAEWNRADDAMGILDDNAPDLPYGVALGNHDYDQVNNQREAARYVSFFGASRYSERPWYGGSSPDQRNHYQQFAANGRNYLHITLEWNPRPSSLRWAQSVLDDHPNDPTIVSTHDYLTPGGFHSSPAGRHIFDKLIYDNSQVFMVLSGHALQEDHNIATNAAGLEIFELLANYQGRPNGGDGWMRLIEFDDANDQIRIATYSPTLDEFEVDSDSQFTLNFNPDLRFGAVPEPSSFVLLLGGLATLAMRLRRTTRD